MKDLLKKPVTFEKAEFWAATAIYTIAVFVLLGKMPEVSYFSDYSSYYIPTICRYTVFYISFILLSFFIVKSLVNGKHIAISLILLLGLFISAVMALVATDTWLNDYLFANQPENIIYNNFFKQELVIGTRMLLVFGFYTAAKSILQALLPYINIRFADNKQLMQECLIALAFWALAVFFLKMTHTGRRIPFIWSEVLLFGLVAYWYFSYYTIAAATTTGADFSRYIQKVCVVIIVAYVPVTLCLFAILRRVAEAFIVGLFDAGIGLFIAAPVVWLLYRYRTDKRLELQGLKTELGRSSANLDFLRSQINPHFLFNALNTLYGTSLQENAERTGEGIQKLGDMMRFMLQENVQEKISLAREVDYLNNYIDLQKLRTQSSPDIVIQTEIDTEITGMEIAPMLLIPFVENAFKHGISLRERSHIKISLQIRDQELLFDVYNSIHPKAGNDPEKNKSGIGLENVKQRLLLLYPKRHELVIRESAKEFFIHLTVQL